MNDAEVEEAPEPPELVVISGMSGAGRSTAAKVLEDLGWFVVDNLPPSLIATMVDLAARTQGSGRGSPSWWTCAAAPSSTTCTRRSPT
jgi:hypothetical protein